MNEIVIPDRIPLSNSDLEKIQSLGDVKIYDDIPENDDVLLERIKDARIITANWVSISDKLLEQLPNLQYIIVPAVGYEWVDSESATRRNIDVLNCPTQNADAVANLTIGLMFALTRRIFEANHDLQEGTWDPTKYKGIELQGKKLGLIGYGNIGKRVATLAQVLGMDVTYVNSKSSPEDIDRLVSESDIVSLHAPLTKATENILDDRRLSLMKQGAYVINLARGKEVDYKSLVKHLTSGHLAGAALDVFVDEPLVGNPSQEIIDLTHVPNLIATPHIGSNTHETDERLGKELIANIQSCLDGNPINVVNRRN